MTNPFIDLVGPQNPFAEPKSTRNPFVPETSIMPQPVTESLFAATKAVSKASEIPFAERHPFLDMLLVQPFRDGADALVVTFTPQERLSALAQEDPAGTLQLVNNAQNGAAFFASLPIGAAFTKIPGVSRVLGSAGAFLIGEFLSGNVYGAIRPLEEDESRLEAMIKTGAIFAGAGGLMAGGIHGVGRGFDAAGRGYKRYIMALPGAKRIEAIRLAQRRLGEVNTNLMAAGHTINGLPPEAKASIVSNIYRDALKEVEPAADIDLDRIVREQAELDIAHEQVAVEPSPRFGPMERPKIKVGPEPIELTLPDPLDEITLTPEFRAPARVEPQLQPAGLIRGAGAPERAKGIPIFHGTAIAFEGSPRLRPGIGTLYLTENRQIAQLRAGEILEVRGVKPEAGGEQRVYSGTIQPAKPLDLDKPPADFVDLMERRASTRLGEPAKLRTASETGTMYDFTFDFTRHRGSRNLYDVAEGFSENEIIGAARDLGYDAVTFKEPVGVPGARTWVALKSSIVKFDEGVVAARLTATPPSMKALPDGSIEVIGYRGVAPGRDPLHPGVGESTFMADDPSIASRYKAATEDVATAGFGPLGAKQGTLARIRAVFKKPLIVDDFADLEMGPEDAARYRTYVDKEWEGTLTPAERADGDAIMERALSTGDAIIRARSAGYDGIIVRGGMEGMEIIALDQKAARVASTIHGSDIKFEDWSQNRIMDSFVANVLDRIRGGRNIEEAIDLSIMREIQNIERETAIKTGRRPRIDDLPELRKAYEKIAEFMGEDIGPTAHQTGIPGTAWHISEGSFRGEVREGTEPAMRQLLRNLEREAADNRLRKTAEDVAGTFEFEPRAYTEGVQPPAGFQPTRVGEAPKGIESTVEEQLAMTDASVRSAVARIDPLDLAGPDIKSSRQLIEDAVADRSVPKFQQNSRIARALDKALAREGPASAEDVLLQMTGPTPDVLSAERNLPRAVRRRMAADLSRSLSRESENLVEISPGELVRAHWAYGAESVVTPSLDVMETASHMTDDQLQMLGERMRRLATGEAGFITGKMLAFMLGSGAEVASFNEDLAPTPAAQNTWRAIGGLLLAASLHGAVRGWMQRSKFMRSFILNANPSFLMKDAGSKEGFRKFVETLTWSRELGYDMRKEIESVFPDKRDWRNAILAIEESDFANGVFSAEYHQLNPVQQRMVESLSLFNLALGNILKSEGVMKGFLQNYIPHRLPPETFQRWTTHGFRTLPTGGGFTKQRILGFRELEQWARQNNLPGPITDMAQLQWRHIQEAYRAIGTTRLIKTLDNLGLIKDAAANATILPPAGWRQLRIAGYGTKEAPDEIAHALENIASSGSSRSEVLNAADTIKSAWMRSIMFWFWEHGLNALRAATLVSLNPVRYGDAWKAIARMDPGVLEAAKYGLNLRQRTDYAEVAKSIERMIQRTQKIPVLRDLAKIGGGLMHFNETALWEKIVPTMQYMTYAKNMFEWSERTGGKFLPGSREYITAARRSADVANTVLGRLPTDLANPRLMQWARLVLFSPQWTTTRVAMLSHAAGELGDVLAGKLNPAEATYLPMQLRRAAMVVGLTWLLSRALSGEDPEFNPNTHKFYAKTGLRGANGREIGLDVTGFWQDDIKIFNSPFRGYIGNRLNPVFRLAGETINGRDYLGRPMTNIQSIENITRSFGPPTELLEFMARAGQSAMPGGTPGMTGGEILQRVSGMLASGNVASLPRPMDAALGKMAERLLRNQGMAADEQSVFELSRLLRGNLLAGHSLIDNRVVTYLAYRKRGINVRSPLGGPAEHLWQEARRVVAEF